MKKNAVLVVTLVAFLSGCATEIGKPVDTNAVNKFVVGQTTIAQAEQVLGQPFQSSQDNNGTTELEYYYNNTKSNVASYLPGADIFASKSASNTQIAYLYFDKNGLFQRSKLVNNNTNN